jgi:hypothetical protein
MHEHLSRLDQVALLHQDILDPQRFLRRHVRELRLDPAVPPGDALRHLALLRLPELPAEEPRAATAITARIQMRLFFFGASLGMAFTYSFDEDVVDFGSDGSLVNALPQLVRCSISMRVLSETNGCPLRNSHPPPSAL